MNIWRALANGFQAVNRVRIPGRPSYKRVALHAAIGLGLWAASAFWLVTKYFSEPGTVPLPVVMWLPWVIPTLYLIVLWHVMNDSPAMGSWAQTRQRGRRHFVITHGVILFGVPLGFSFFGLGLLLIEPRDVLLASLYLPGFLVFGWLWGDYVWSRREKAFEQYSRVHDENASINS